MLAEIETGLIELLKDSPLRQRVRQIDTLPDLEGDSLIGRFTTDAPAIYVAMGSFQIANRNARPKYGIACVARNSRGHQAARHGDGVVIGLYEMLDAVMELVDSSLIAYRQGVVDDEEFSDAVSFEVTGVDLVSSESLFQKGIYAGVVQIQSIAEVPFSGVTEQLADFKTFHADYDIDPHQAQAEHDKWLQEPPDHSTSAPELTDQLKLQE